MAWRFNAGVSSTGGAASGAPGTGFVPGGQPPPSSAFTGGPREIGGAGAFLRSIATSNANQPAFNVPAVQLRRNAGGVGGAGRRPQDRDEDSSNNAGAHSDEDGEDEEEERTGDEEEESVGQDSRGRNGGGPKKYGRDLDNVESDDDGGDSKKPPTISTGFKSGGAALTKPGALAKALQVNRPLFGTREANPEFASNFLRAAAAGAAGPNGEQDTFRNLTKKFQVAGAAGMRGEDEDEEDELGDEEGEEVSQADKKFIHDTRTLFRDIDRSYLSETFVPYEQVMMIITPEGTGADATREEIETKLSVFYDLKGELDEYLGNYVEEHYAEFNTSISDFSELILALSGSDETLALLKVQLAQAASFLESHAEQLVVLRKRAAKALIMRETLLRLQACLSCESKVKQLVSAQHYLAAVKMLRDYESLLSDPEIADIRLTKGLRTFVDSTLQTVHVQIIDDLLACVFRQDRLQEASGRIVKDIVRAGEAEGMSDGGASSSAPGAFDFNRSAPSSASPGGDGATAAPSMKRRDSDSRLAVEQAAGNQEVWTVLTANSVLDDPTEANISRNFSRFIPLCVKSLDELGKLEQCHEAFFSKTTKKIEHFIAEFLRVYGSWRRRSTSTSNVAGGSGDATVRAIRVSAFELVSTTMSFDEAVVVVQRRELRALLTSLFAELEKIIRNADYLIKTIAVKQFSFLAPFLFSPTAPKFDVDSTSRMWDITSFPIVNNDRMRIIVASVQESIRVNESNPVVSDVLQRIWAYSDVDQMLQTKRAEMQKKDSFNFGSPSNLARSGTFTVSPTLSPMPFAASMSPMLTPRQGGAADATMFNVHLCLQDLIDTTAAAVAHIRETYPNTNEEALNQAQLDYCAKLNSAIRVYLLEEVRDYFLQWDLKVLWSQLHYHVECIFHVLCDAKEIEDELEDVVTLRPFLKRKTALMRMQTSLANVKANNNKEFPTLDRLLTVLESSTDSLRMYEESGYVPFSITGAVKRTQADDSKRANEGLERQKRALETTGGAAVVPIIQTQASSLKDWFVFTAMNALVCFECAHDFVIRCVHRVPSLTDSDTNLHTVGVQTFLGQFIRSTYIPTLHEFHAQQLRRLFNDMGLITPEDIAEEDVLTTISNMEDPSTAVKADAEGPDGTSPTKGTGGSATKRAPSNSPTIGPSDAANAALTVAEGTTVADLAAAASTVAAEARRKYMNVSSSWPTIDVPSAAYPVLACVNYVAESLRKLARVLPHVPPSVVDIFQQDVGESLVAELLDFLRAKVQFIGRGTLPLRLLHESFEEVFAGSSNLRWDVLCNEADLWDAHSYVDADLYLYYSYNSAQRTSGHQYVDSSKDTLEALVSFDPNRGILNERLGLLTPENLGLRCDSDIVALAVVSYSVEWLGGMMMEILWGANSSSSSQQPHCAELLDCYVPGARFTSTFQGKKIVGTSTATQQRLVQYYNKLMALSQVSLFGLSVETRFTAFQFLPQLRDESYNLVATAATPDTFVQAYCRRVANLFALLQTHLSTAKRKYIAFTLSKPVSELVMLEIAHLRDKAISAPGLTRLQTNLLVMQTTLQLVLPTDDDVRNAVTRFFSRPAIFLRYIPNKDVASDLITSGDFRRFTQAEVETLITLVFRPESGANDNSLAQKHITMYRVKLFSMQTIGEQGLQKSGSASPTTPTPPQQQLQKPPNSAATPPVSPTTPQKGAGTAPGSPGAKKPFADDDDEEEEEEDEEDDEEDENGPTKSSGPAALDANKKVDAAAPKAVGIVRDDTDDGTWTAVARSATQRAAPKSVPAPPPKQAPPPPPASAAGASSKSPTPSASSKAPPSPPTVPPLSLPSAPSVSPSSTTPSPTAKAVAPVAPAATPPVKQQPPAPPAQKPAVASSEDEDEEEYEYEYEEEEDDETEEEEEEEEEETSEEEEDEEEDVKHVPRSNAPPPKK